MDTYEQIRPPKRTPTWSDIRTAIFQNSRIMLIKAIRDLANMGLKDAKDAVDDNCCDSNVNERGLRNYDINPKRTFAYFSKYLGENPEENKRLFKIAQDDKLETANLVKAIELASEIWELLGFKSKKEACLKVVDNMCR